MVLIASIKNYLDKMQKYSPLRFVFEAAFVAKLGSLPLMIFLLIADNIWRLLVGGSQPEIVSETYIGSEWFNPWYLVGALLVAPLIETFINQVVVIKILDLFTTRNSIKIALATLFFALPHAHLSTIIGSIFPGMVFAWAYVTQRRYSSTYAFFITAAIHFLVNFYTMLFMLLMMLL